MSMETSKRWAFVWFPIAGLASALLPVLVNFGRVFGRITSFASIGIFGAFTGICLYWFLDLRSIWRIGGFIVVSIAAWYAAIFAGFLAHRNVMPFEAGAFFIGGFTGAFIILVGAWLLLFPDGKVSGTLLKSLLGALVGGLLGAAGHAAGPIFYRLRLLLPPMTLYGGDSDISLTVIWQTGIALVLAWIVWTEKGRHTMLTARR